MSNFVIRASVFLRIDQKNTLTIRRLYIIISYYLIKTSAHNDCTEKRFGIAEKKSRNKGACRVHGTEPRIHMDELDPVLRALVAAKLFHYIDTPTHFQKYGYRRARAYRAQVRSFHRVRVPRRALVRPDVRDLRA